MALPTVVVYFIAALYLANTIPVEKAKHTKDTSTNNALHRNYLHSLKDNEDKQKSGVPDDKRSPKGNTFNVESLI